ncbi:MAG: 4'-phosphopantetheinyl transferase family protein [Stackebrandtia sp.]
MTAYGYRVSEECLVYWAAPADARPRHRDLFTDDELERADAYRRPVDRDRFIVGCALSRIALGELLRLPPAAVPLLRDCADCGRPHGRPRLGDEAAHLSVSHSGDHVVVAVTRAGPVGVDVEKHAESPLDVATTVLAPGELADWRRGPERVRGFFGYWTRKEAVLKATGDGLRARMTGVRVSAPGAPARLLSFDDRPGLRLWLADLEAGPEHSAALAVATDGPVSVTRLDGARLLDTV